MKRYILALAALMCLLTACSGEGLPEIQGVYTYMESFQREERIYLEVSVEYPKLEEKGDRSKAINVFFEELAQEQRRVVAKDIEPLARESFDYAAAGRSAFNQCAYEVTSAAVRTDERCFSVMSSGYESLGGAHPNSFVSAYNFGAEGQLLSLDDIFEASEQEYIPVIKQLTVEEFARQGLTDMGFEGYQEYMMDVYDRGDFLVTDDGLTIFWQAYAIAPHAAGIPTVDLSWQQLDDILSEEWK